MSIACSSSQQCGRLMVDGGFNYDAVRTRKSQKAKNSCGSTGVQVHEDSQSPSGSLDESLDIETIIKPKVV